MLVGMRLHRFIVGEYTRTGDMIIATDVALAHQLRKVLRLRQGDYALFCLDGETDTQVMIDSYSGDTVIAKAMSVYRVVPEIAVPVTACISLLKRDAFEWGVQKAVENGVTGIQPILAERSVKTGVSQSRLLMIMKEASEQCGRGIVPVLHEPKNMHDALQTVGTHVIFDALGAAADGTRFAGADAHIRFWIGPEGGWSQSELQMHAQAGSVVKNLGATILRADTAVAVASWVACRLWQ